jgi:carbamoyl-phosphate synthase large subunit
VRILSRNVFVTAIGGDIACATLRCIVRNHASDYIIGCDIAPHVQGIMYVNEFVIAPAYKDIYAYLSFIKKICIEKKITHFLPMTEAEIKIMNYNRDFFQEHNIKLMINNELVIQIASSKYKTASFLRSHNILAPQTFYEEDYKDKLSYPIIIKPDSSCGSKNIHIVYNDEEILSALSKPNHYVFQEYIGSADEEYTVGIFSDGNDIKSIALKRKLGFGGMSVFVETIDDPKVDKIAIQVAKSLQLKGSINIQMRKMQEYYYIFEINPRISSTVGFRDMFGFHDVIWWLDLLDGIENNVEYKTVAGRIGIKTLDEMVI